jgi:hypothetical protein
MKATQHLMILGSALILLAGCQKEESMVSSDPTTAGTLKAGQAAVVESVTGSAHLTRNFYEPDVWRTFTFSATKDADGNVKGTYQLKNHNLASLKGTILCFTIEDNKAVLLVRIDQFSSSVSEQSPYPYGYIVVEDGGEGKGSVDKISLHYDTDVMSDCGIVYNVPLYEIEAGNVQVHKSK